MELHHSKGVQDKHFEQGCNSGNRSDWSKFFIKRLEINLIYVEGN